MSGQHSPAVPDDKLKSRTIGNYIIGKTLGKGTFGKVKLATQILTGEKVAIKILEKDRIIDVADVERVSREIHILKLIRHPNIIQLYEIIETPKQLFLIMQYMQNGELFDYIVEKKRLDQKEACQIFQQIISGIQYIHKLNIVHRDLKPQNLLLDYDKTIRLVDFGLSNTYKKDQRLKTACGSPCYAAPQMIEAKHKYQPLLVDIWSCGVILYAMLCGSLPFEDPQTPKLYQKILSGQYKVHSYLSPDARDMLAKILTVDPNKRYNIDQIRKHKWWKMIPEKPCSQGLIVGYHRIPIDHDILNKLQPLKMDIQFAQRCLQANRHNHSTTSYYLVMKKHLRDGGSSKADLGSKNFDKSLIQPLRKNRTNSIGEVILNSSPDKNDTKSNYLSLLKGKISGNETNTHSHSKSKELKRQNSFDPNMTKQAVGKKYYSVGKKRGISMRDDTRDNNAIQNRYKDKYGYSMVSRSNSKTRNNSNSIRHSALNNSVYNSNNDKKRNSTFKKIAGHYDIQTSKNIETKHVSKTLYIGSQTPYERTIGGKSKQSPFNSPTIDLKQKPYFNRRAMYRK